MTDVEIITDLVTEPVSLAEAKIWCRVDVDYTGDDVLILELIKSAREQLEMFTGLSFGEKTLKQFSDKKCIELLYPPIVSIEKITDEDGNEITLNHPFKRRHFIEVHVPVYVEYKAGYAVDKLPVTLKQAMKMQIVTDYDNRENFVVGETVTELSNSAKRKAWPYSRNLLL